MNKIIISKDQYIYNDSYVYTLIEYTPIYINDNIYFTDDDIFFHFSKKKSSNYVKEIQDIINSYINIFNCFGISNIIQSDEESSIHSKQDNNNFYIKLPKNTPLKFNDIIVSSENNILYEIKPYTKFIIPQNSNIELISRTNIFNIITTDDLYVQYSKLI
jgi:hypothetical protein